MSNFELDNFKIFLASVKKVLLTENDFLELKTKTDYIKIYNDNKNFGEKDSRFLGSIIFQAHGSTLNLENYAFPIDKNIMTFPIQGESVLILKYSDEYYWLPYTVTQYPNYREDYKTSEATKERTLQKSENKNDSYKNVQSTGTPNNQTNQSDSQKKKYIVKEKIKFLKPKEGDTILQGRVGNSIRLSESFLVPEADSKDASPSIIIRNRQSEDATNKKIGELVEEDINKDGSSIYIVSNKVKIPYNHSTIKKEKIGFKDYPKDSDFTGDRIFINTDQILLASKSREFIITGKGNTGIITDGRFSVDAAKEIYLHNEKDITLHSKGSNKIFLNSDNGGKIYLGKNTGEGAAGAAVQKMVLGGELVKILGQLIDAINQQVYATPVGPTTPGPTNRAAFTAIKGQLNTLLSARNYLSKT
jgi:hypothetical protein